MVLPRYKLVPNPKFVSYYYQLVIMYVQYTFILGIILVARYIR